MIGATRAVVPPVRMPLAAELFNTSYPGAGTRLARITTTNDAIDP